MLAYFMRRTGNPELAADLAAETFAAALISTKRYRVGRAPAMSWLFGIARHRLLRSVERGRVEDRARRRLGMPTLVLDEDMLDRIERLGSEQRVEALLEHLPPDQAAAVRARVVDERPYSEIASSMRCSEAVVRKRVSRGLTARREQAKGHR